MDYVMTEAKNPLDLATCKMVAETLTPTYPGHTWYVEVNDGMLIIKSLKVATNAGTMVPLRNFDGDAERLRREVVMAAGAFLEAAGLKRGAFQGENAKHLEGLPNGQRAHMALQPKIYSPDELIVDV